MNSCLYEMDITHSRLKPKRHKFTNRIFMFYLDLDEVDQLAEELKLFSRNRYNVYTFRDQDHMDWGGKNVKENISRYLKTKGLDGTVDRVMLLTNVRVLGYVFNPVSFYFCFNNQKKPVCVVPQIGNTFGELKPFFLGGDTLSGQRFRDTQIKYYYISPFTDLDLPMEFDIGIPQDRLDIRINDYQGKDRLLVTSMTGRRHRLDDGNLLRFGLTIPFVTLKVIFFIHFHAAILHYIKRLPHHNKESNPELQKGVLNAWRKD